MPGVQPTNCVDMGTRGGLGVRLVGWHPLDPVSDDTVDRHWINSDD
jgi:hypothetical protein